MLLARGTALQLSMPTCVGAPVRSPVSISGSESGKLLEAEQPMAGHPLTRLRLQFSLLSPQIPTGYARLGSGSACSQHRKVSNELPPPRAQVPASTLDLGRVTGAEQNRFQKNKQPGAAVHTGNPSS